MIKKLLIFSTIFYYSCISFGAQAGTRESHLYGVIVALIMSEGKESPGIPRYLDELCSHTKNIKKSVDAKTALIQWDLDLCTVVLSSSAQACDTLFAEARTQFRAMVTQKCL